MNQKVTRRGVPGPVDHLSPPVGRCDSTARPRMFQFSADTLQRYRRPLSIQQLLQARAV